MTKTTPAGPQSPHDLKSPRVSWGSLAICPHPQAPRPRALDFMVSALLALAMPFQSSLGVSNTRTKLKTGL